MRGYHYIAAPFTASQPEKQLERVTASGIACHRMLRLGGMPYSPLVHGYFIEQLGGGQVPYGVWMDHCLAILSKAQAFYILTLEGWQDSKGVAIEKEFAIKHGIPVGYLNAAVWAVPGEAGDALVRLPVLKHGD